MQSDLETLKTMLIAAQRIKTKTDGLVYEDFKDNETIVHLCHAVSDNRKQLRFRIHLDSTKIP